MNNRASVGRVHRRETISGWKSEAENWKSSWLQNEAETGAVSASSSLPSQAKGAKAQA